MGKLNNGDVTNALDSFYIDYVIGEHDHDTTIKDLHKQHADMVNAVNEWHEKAKAWDSLMAEIDRITEESAVKGLPPKTTLVTKVIAVTMAKKEYESGESDEL